MTKPVQPARAGNPTLGSSFADYPVKPIFGVGGEDWKRLRQFAHSFGEGPVSVYVELPTTGADFSKYASEYDWTAKEVSDFEGYINQQSMALGAKSVAAWNKAAGVAVFRLTDVPTDADIVIHPRPDKQMPASADGKGLVLGQGGPTSAPGEPSHGSLETYGVAAGDTKVGVHELGHTIGLDHPDTPLTRIGGSPYADPNEVMSGGTIPSPEEGDLVRKLYAQPITPANERHGAQLAAERPNAIAPDALIAARRADNAPERAARTADDYIYIMQRYPGMERWVQEKVQNVLVKGGVEPDAAAQQAHHLTMNAAAVANARRRQKHPTASAGKLQKEQV